MTMKLPINLESLLHCQLVEDVRVEYKKGWNPQAVLHSLILLANKRLVRSHLSRRPDK